jgi:hypothetical protein
MGPSSVLPVAAVCACCREAVEEPQVELSKTDGTLDETEIETSKLLLLSG